MSILWDTLAECDIRGADDGSIKNPVANDLSLILSVANIRKIYTTGTKATGLYKNLIYPKTGIESVYLPSTSPANRGQYSFDGLVEVYMQIREVLNPNSQN